MLRKDDIKRILDEIGVITLIGVRKEINDLPKFIDDESGETILYACTALYEGNTWLLTCTNRKLIFLDKGLMYGLKKIEIPISKINSISYQMGMAFGDIEIFHGSSVVVLKNINKKALTPMTNAINKAIKEAEHINQKNIKNNTKNDEILILQNEKIIEYLSLIYEEIKNKNGI